MAWRFGLLLVMLIGLVASRPAPRSAEAFKLYVHEDILKEALGPLVSEQARTWVYGSVGHGIESLDLGFFGGTGGASSDNVAGQFYDYLHFDSAKNPTEICERWQKGVDRPLNGAAEWAVLLADRDSLRIFGRDRLRELAFQRFGTVTHAIADFYAHSNWVELKVEELAGPRDGRAGRIITGPFPKAPIAEQTCDPGRFPSDLQTGYASMWWYLARAGLFGIPAGIAAGVGTTAVAGPVAGVGAGLGGGSLAASVGAGWCAPTGPPSGFKFCHDDLAKDENSGIGGQYPDQEHPELFQYSTLHSLAKHLAILSTIDAYDLLRERTYAAIRSNPRNRDVDLACIWRTFSFGRDTLATGLDETCRPSCGSERMPARPEDGRADALIAKSLTESPAATDQPASCSAAPSALAGSYSAASGLKGEIIDEAARGAARWGIEGDLVTLTRGEARVDVRADGTVTGGTMVLEATKPGGRTGRFEGTVDTSSFTVVEDPSNGQNPGAIFGHVHFRGPARFCDPGRNPSCRESTESIKLEYVFTVRDLHPTGELALCREVNRDRCAAAPLGVLTRAGGPSAVATTAGAPSTPRPDVEATWGGTFTTSRGPLQLTQTGGVVIGAYEPNGHIVARTVGGRLRGAWFEGSADGPPDAAGDLELILSEDGGSFTGRSNSAADPEQWRDDWRGSRTSAAGGTPATSSTPPSSPSSTPPTTSTPPSASMPAAGTAPPPPLRVDITTDKRSYRIGDSITVCITVSEPGRARLIDKTPAGQSEISNGDVPAGMTCTTGSVTPPTGTECIRLEFSAPAGAVVSAEACFEVTAAASSPAATPPMAAGACAQWDITGTWQTAQGNGYNPAFAFQQGGTRISGTATLTAGEAARAGFTSASGTVTGTLSGSQLDVTVTWSGRSGPVTGRYTATVAQGRLTNGRAGSESWSGTGPTRCAMPG